jgi:hypothetical protein
MRSRLARMGAYRTVFHPEDDDYLIDRETTVRHYEVPGPP